MNYWCIKRNKLLVQKSQSYQEGSLIFQLIALDVFLPSPHIPLPSIRRPASKLQQKQAPLWWISRKKETQ